MKVTRLLPPLLLILASSGFTPAVWATDKLTGPRLTPDQWQAPDQLDHPLLGIIWSRPTGDISAAELLDSLPRGGWLLLGEQHDHPDHHQIQVTLLKALAQHVYPQRTGVLITGAVHAQQAIGVPRWLEPEQLPHLSLLLRSLNETINHTTDASAYLPESLGLDVSEREFLLFTAALPEQDHCAGISP